MYTKQRFRESLFFFPLVIFAQFVFFFSSYTCNRIALCETQEINNNNNTYETPRIYTHNNNNNT